jgi:cysteinyl-tRNA synthetase
MTAKANPVIMLHNTLSRHVEPLKPIKPGQVSLYTCGPTVYNYYHIGNLRNAVFNDTLRRTLQAAGLQVNHVMNITDVGHLVSDADDGEDKLEKGAAREGKTVWEVAKHYSDAFKHDMKLMNVLPPSINPHRSKNRDDHDPYARATDFIPEQIDMVKTLLDQNIAYQTRQAIYFDVAKLDSYGELTGQKLADKEIAARSDVITDPDKRGPHDFAVWFFTVGHFKDHSMHWKSPWGDGFPGWHLECSAIIHATLDGHTADQAGHPIDIHTGGVDHIGTHHPNEMAQTEAAFGHPLAQTWVHNEFILVDGAKMSKSKGNSYTLADITERKTTSGQPFHPLVLRLLYLQSHYRSELNFSWESLEAAQNRLLELQAWADLRYQPSTHTMPDELDNLFLTTRQTIQAALADDLNTPAALAALGQLVAYMSTHPVPAVEGRHTDGTLAYLDEVFGLNLANRPDITPQQKTLIDRREQARAAKDWETADQLRGQLAQFGLEINDTPHGPRWRRTMM